MGKFALVFVFGAIVCFTKQSSAAVFSKYADSIRYENGVVKIVFSHAFDVTGELQVEPVRRLSKALRLYKKARFFRLIWWDTEVSTVDAATALYDRRKKQLTYYDVTTISGLGNEGIKPQTESWKFRRVTDEMIHKVAKKHPGTNMEAGSMDSFLAEVARYGARQISWTNRD